MTQTNDALVDEYLERVARAAAGLLPDRRDELVRDLREHIETERAELDGDSEAGVREILERLGDPEMIAREAAQETGNVLTVAPPVIRKRRTTMWIIVGAVVVLAILVLCAGTTLLSRSSQSGSVQPAPTAS
jgi:uncharacterized membrane protein